MKYLLIFISSFIVFVANADPLAKDVNVVNTPEVNISGPVNANITNTPTVEIGNTPNVNVLTMPQVELTVPSALDVNVQNTPGVTIENGLQEPVPVEITNQSNGGELVNIVLMGQFAEGEYYATEYEAPIPPMRYEAPIGKKLIVRHVACNLAVAYGTQVKAEFNMAIYNSDSINGYRASNYNEYFFPILFTKVYSTGTSVDWYHANHSMSAIVGGISASNYLQLRARRDNASDIRTIYCALTGELMDI